MCVPGSKLAYFWQVWSLQYLLLFVVALLFRERYDIQPNTLSPAVVNQTWGAMLQAPEITFAAPSLLPAPQTPLSPHQHYVFQLLDTIPPTWGAVQQAPQTTFAVPPQLLQPQPNIPPAFNTLPLPALHLDQPHPVALHQHPITIPPTWGAVQQTPQTTFAVPQQLLQPQLNIPPAFNPLPLPALHLAEPHPVALHQHPVTKQKPRVKPKHSPPPPPPNDPAPSSSAASEREKQHKKSSPVDIPSRIQPSPRRKTKIPSSVASFRERSVRNTERAFKTSERATKTKRTRATSSSSNPVPEQKKTLELAVLRETSASTQTPGFSMEPKPKRPCCMDRAPRRKKPSTSVYRRGRVEAWSLVPQATFPTPCWCLVQ